MRRTLFIAVFALAAGLSTTTAAAADTTRVNLWVGNGGAELAVGDSGEQTIEIGNRGPAPHSGPVSVKFTTPFFWNVIVEKLPKSCTYLLHDTRANVPEVIECKVPNVDRGTSVEVKIPLTVLAGGPVGPAYGQVNVTPDTKSGATMQEINYSDNWTSTGAIVLDRTEAGKKTPANLYLRSDVPIVPSNTVTPLHLYVGSTGGQPTVGDTALTVIMPFFVNNAAAVALPAGCAFVLEDKDPTVPEIVLCQLTQGIRQGKERELIFHIDSPTEGPRGPVSGRGLVMPSTQDGDMPDNTLEIPVQLAL